MKILLPGVVLLGSLCAPVLWAHHAAEGIISDDIWNMIDDNLLEADSPHIDFDPDNPGNLMELDVDDETNRAVIVSTGIIEFTDDVLMDDAAGIIETEFSPVFDTTMSDMNSIPTGMMGYVVEAIVDEGGDGIADYAVITISEPIGQGNSQDLPPDDLSSPPGKRSGG